MKHIVAIGLAAVLVSAGAVSAQAGGRGHGASSFSPGHKMQAKGSISGHPGASGYAPGHRMQARGSVAGMPGASGYAPGHRKANVTAGTHINRHHSTVGAGVRIE